MSYNTQKQPSDTTHDSITQQLKALDTASMTEEDARLAGITLLEEYVAKNKSYARSTVVFNIIWDLICAVLFGDPGDFLASEYADYRRAKKTLNQFRKRAYKKSYIQFLKDWQDRTLSSEECEAKTAAAPKNGAQNRER